MTRDEAKVREFARLIGLSIPMNEEERTLRFLNLLVDGFKFSDIEIKRAAGGDLLVSGHGSVFGNVDGHNDIVETNAFRESLAEHERDGSSPKMYLNHNYEAGEAGTWYHFSEDEKGLLVRGVIHSAKPQGRKAVELHSDGKLVGLSIGYKALQQDRSNGIRHLKKVHLAEVSLVSSEFRPSNPLAQLKPSESKHANALAPAAGYEYQ